VSQLPAPFSPPTLEDLQRLAGLVGRLVFGLRQAIAYKPDGNAATRHAESLHLFAALEALGGLLKDPALPDVPPGGGYRGRGDLLVQATLLSLRSALDALLREGAIRLQPGGQLVLHRQTATDPIASPAAIARLEEAAGRLMAFLAAPQIATPALIEGAAQPQPPKSEKVSLGAIEALLGKESQQVLAVARGDDSADDKMRAICAIDRRYLGWNSVQWAQLLGVKDAAIRKTTFWISDRKLAIEADRELRDEDE
jgi:hypothetical protein